MRWADVPRTFFVASLRNIDELLSITYAVSQHYAAETLRATHITPFRNIIDDM